MADLKSVIAKIKWPLLYLLWAVHGVIAFLQFIGSVFFEYSTVYLFISFFLLLWIVFAFALFILDFQNTHRWSPVKILSADSRKRDATLLIALLLITVRIGCWYLRGLLGPQLMLLFGGYLDILQPVLNLTFYVALEIALIVGSVNLSVLDVKKGSFQSFLLCLLALLFVFGILIVVISNTGLGIASSYRGDWQRGLPAVPLLEWQILLAGLCVILLTAVERRIKPLDLHHFDLAICMILWIAAVAIWLSEPVIPNASALAPHEPNFEVYPFIDAQTYDELAQSILIGDGFGEGQIPQRPFYIVFLAFAHLLAGQAYHHVVLVQTLVFALFPVLLFLLGRDLFSRPVGISIALLAILRDYTSNIVSPFTGNLSYSKVFLSEIPTAMFLILFLILGVRWIKSGFPNYLGISMGGVLGLAMLIRTQSIVLMPVLLVFLLLYQPVKISTLIRASIPILLTAMLVISPWLWRNWIITGDLIFDNPESQTMNLALRYSRINGVDEEIVKLPGETSAEFSLRLKQIAKQAILSNPRGAAWALANSFINHGINNILVFPLRNEINKLDDLLFPSDAFWEKWEGQPTPFQTMVLAFYIFLFSLGVTAAWRHTGWLGLLPLSLNLVYNLWTSIALLSGQRFMLAMDWSVYLYYLMGVFALLGGILFVLNSSRTFVIKLINDQMTAPMTLAGNVRWQGALLMLMIFLGLGLSLPLAEKLFPQKYPRLPTNQVSAPFGAPAAFENLPVDQGCFAKLVDEHELSFEQGRALYPRYYEAGDGEDFTDTPGYRIAGYGRLVFDVIGQKTQRIIFPMSGSPIFFPHASNVTLAYGEGVEQPWFILVNMGGEGKIYVSDDFDERLCD